MEKDRQGEISAELFKFARGMAWLFLFAFIILLLYTFYRSEIVLVGLHSSRYFKYYLISIFGILFWGVILKLSDETRFNVVTVISSMVVGLYFFEISLVLLAKDPRMVEAGRKGVNFDSRSKYEVYSDLRKKGVDVVPAIHPMQFVLSNGIPGSDVDPLFPFGGVSEKTTIVCNESGEYVFFMSDRYGFNNPDPVWDNDQVDWLLTGDSFTQGTCVKQGEEIAGQIRKRTRESVINLGSGSNGPLVELAVLEEYAKARKPKTVLWVYYEGNDLAGDLQFEMKSSLLMKYIKREFSQGLMARQTEIDLNLIDFIKEQSSKKEHETKNIRWSFGILRLLNLRAKIGFDNIGSDLNVNVVPFFGDILKKARDMVASWGGQIYFVYLPATSRYAELKRDDNQFYRRDKVMDIIKGLDISVIDIHQLVFAKHPDPQTLFVFSGGHFNAKGYNTVANAIIGAIEKERLN